MESEYHTRHRLTLKTVANAPAHMRGESNKKRGRSPRKSSDRPSGAAFVRPRPGDTSTEKASNPFVASEVGPETGRATASPSAIADYRPARARCRS